MIAQIRNAMRGGSSVLFYLALAGLLAGFAPRARAQDDTPEPVGGSISGHVMAATAAGQAPQPLAGAKIKAVNQTANLLVQTESGADGSYELPNLLSGTWDLIASASGYRSAHA